VKMDWVIWNCKNIEISKKLKIGLK
jgi:hypothetical protein